jgi:hypothetical protein
VAIHQECTCNILQTRYYFKDNTKPTPVFDIGYQGELFQVHRHKDHLELLALSSNVIVLLVSTLNLETV